MKNIILMASLALGLIACNQQKNQNQSLQFRIDSLEKKMTEAYKPGLGEFMSSIQVHHNKLWFAGKNENWKLADFEIGEIKESLDYIKRYCTDRPEISSLGIIDPAIDSISHAIQQKSLLQFKSSYVLLTNTCNNCHRATQHEFNVIIIPDKPPFSNQAFSIK